jgi:hypothetical protein
VQQDSGITAVAHAIQLSVAPVFLLSGIAAILAVMTNRLSRIIDRARALEAQLPSLAPEATRPLHRELATLSRRAKLISGSIALCTTTALLVCAVIVTGFLGVVFLRIDIAVPVALLFVTAMVTFFAGLVLFLREIFVATANLRIGPH